MDKHRAQRFEHDCEDCIFLGQGKHNGHSVDWYICPDKKNPSMSTVIARFSDEGSDYSSYHWDHFAKLAEDGFNAIPKFEPGVHELDWESVGLHLDDDDLDQYEDDLDDEDDHRSIQHDQSELPID